MQSLSFGNIMIEKAIDVSSADFAPKEFPFFMRSDVAGNIKYLPAGCTEDTEAITITVEAQVYFVDNRQCRKIFKTGTTATGIYIGYPI